MGREKKSKKTTNGLKQNRKKHRSSQADIQYKQKTKKAIIETNQETKHILNALLGDPPLKSYQVGVTQGGLNDYSVNQVPNLINSKEGLEKNLVMKNTMPQIARLFGPTFIIADKDQEEKYLYPSSYQGPPGPRCNWRKCSNKGGCGSECVCHPAGQYGWRCIPKCCIGRDGYPPCRQIYNYPVMCTLPCSTWPGLCQENFWNPYHIYQGPLQSPANHPNLSAQY